MLDFMVKVSFLIPFFFHQKITKSKPIGMYFSSSLFYSSKYAKDSPGGRPFIICMITPGNVYPGLFSFPLFFFSKININKKNQ